MQLYSERHSLRTPTQKTYNINRDVYFLLLNCCKKFQKNLTHIFTLKCHDNYTDSDYIKFDEKGFETRIKIKIPSLFRDKNDQICIPENEDEYDQYALLDLVEYVAKSIKDITERWNNDRYRNYRIINFLDSSEVFSLFQTEINEIFSESGLLYELTDEKIVERIFETSLLTSEMENSFLEIREQGTRELLEEAIVLYKTPNSQARKISVEKIWDAFERLKTYHTSLNKKQLSEKIVNAMAHGQDDFEQLFNTEFDKLTKIGNTYRIRHHETDKIEITDNRYCDYFFNRCLSLIALAIQFLE